MTIKQRQAEGIAIAQEKGRHLGRPAATYPVEWQAIYNKWKSGEVTAKNAMESLNLKRTTFYKLAKAYENSLVVHNTNLF